MSSNPERTDRAEPDLERRDFIGKAGAAVATAVIAPGVFLHTASAKAPADPVSTEVRWGMLVDTARCADGCSACVDACHKENGIDLLKPPTGQSQTQWEAQRPQWIRKVTVRDKLSGETTHLPLMCQHCEHPPCVDVCPTGASFRRADGIVMVDRHTCIGCRYCMMACPYKARSFIHEDIASKLTRTPRGKGCVESCNLCVHRLDGGDLSTACADACRTAGHQAIVFGDLKDPQSAVSKGLRAHRARQLRADLELNTGVRYANV